MRKLPFKIAISVLAASVGLHCLVFADKPYQTSIFQQGVQSYQQGRYEEAVGQFETVLRKNPEHYQSLYYMAATLVQLKRTEEALPYYKKVVQLAPETEAGRLAKNTLKKLAGSLDSGQLPIWTATNSGGVGSRNGMVNVSYSPESSAGGDYVGYEDSIRRWPEGAMPLKIYIETTHEPKRYAAAKRALDAWVSGSEGLFSYKEVSSPESADIRLVWVHHLSADSQLSGDTAKHRAGQTTWTEVKSVMTSAKIQLPLNETRTQLPLSPEETYTALLHEFGHAMGLGHSPDPYDVMYYALSPYNQTGKLSRRDTNSLVKLYGSDLAKK